MPELIREAPPAERRPAIDWASLILRISEEAPDEWVLAARDVPTSSAGNLIRRYGVEARTKGSDPKTHRADKLYIKFNTETSVLTPACLKIRERRERAKELRAKIAAKSTKSTKQGAAQ